MTSLVCTYRFVDLSEDSDRDCCKKKPAGFVGVMTSSVCFSGSGIFILTLQLRYLHTVSVHRMTMTHTFQPALVTANPEL